MNEKHYKVDFGFKPHALQQGIIDHLDGKEVCPVTGKPYRFFVAALGRQWGKSWLAKYLLLDRAINKGQTCQWVAPAIPSARDHWNGLVALIENSGLPVKAIRQQAYEIYFYGGGSIRVRSALVPDNLRGPTLDLLILDEAAFFRNGEYVWNSVCQPMITASGGQVLFTSTPNGRNWFWEIFKRGLDPKNKFYKSWNYPSVSSPYQDPELLEEIKSSVPALSWREEYMAEFLVDGGGVFAGVEKASIVRLLPGPLEGHEYVAGVDFGQNNDASVFTVIDKGTREQVYGERWTSVGTTETVNRIIGLMHHWQPYVTVVEKNGIGESLYSLMLEVLGGTVDELVMEFVGWEDLSVDFAGGHKLRGVHVDNNIKRGNVDRLAADIEYGRLFLLEDDNSPYVTTQLSEMSTYERDRTPSGLVTYNAAKDCHDDTIAALALAYSAVPKPPKFRKPKKKGKKRANPLKRGRRNLNAKRSKVRNTRQPRETDLQRSRPH